MRSPLTRRAARVGALALAVVVAAACSGVDEGTTTGLTEPAPVHRLGRIHVAVQAPAEIASDGPALEISARFVQYRGLDEAAVRQRVGLLPLAGERLKIGECTASELPWEEPATRDQAANREVSLIDVGNIAVQLGEASVDVPLSLVPDLLAYMSGVEYDLASEVLPARAWPPGEPGPTAVTITVDGAGDDELPGFSVRAPLPEPVVLQATATPDRDSLLLEWGPDGRGAPVVLRLTGFIGSEPAGDEVACLVSDTGSHRVDLDALRSAGYVLSGDTLRVGASRITRTRLDAGEGAYGEGADAVIEMRSETLVTWP